MNYWQNKGTEVPRVASLPGLSYAGLPAYRGISVIGINPAYTSQDCSNCGRRAKKSLSTRTHSCANCGVEICRDTNAALNILKKGMKMLGGERQHGTVFSKRNPP